jgi:hypothetical protein
MEYVIAFGVVAMMALYVLIIGHCLPRGVNAQSCQIDPSTSIHLFAR